MNNYHPQQFAKDVALEHLTLLTSDLLPRLGLTALL